MQAMLLLVHLRPRVIVMWNVALLTVANAFNCVTEVHITESGNTHAEQLRLHKASRALSEKTQRSDEEVVSQLAALEQKEEAAAQAFAALEDERLQVRAQQTAWADKESDLMAGKRCDA